MGEVERHEVVIKEVKLGIKTFRKNDIFGNDLLQVGTSVWAAGEEQSELSVE